MVRRLLCSYMIFVIFISGCTNRYGRFEFEPENERLEITQAHLEFSDLADLSDLPSQYVSEGKIGVSKVEAALERADSFDIQARAELNKKIADINARRTEIEAQVNQNLSQADALREKFGKEYNKALAQTTAREAELNALINRKDTIISSLAKEGESKYSDLLANGREKLDSEMARIEQLKSIYKAIEVESNARIVEMVQSSKATRERADATVLELQTEASSTKLETEARVSELQRQIKSAAIQVNSEIDRLNVLRDTIIKDSAAQIKEIRTRADTIQANLADNEYQLKLTEAQTNKAKSQARTQEKSANAPTRFDRAMAEIDRLRAEVNHHQATAAAGFDSNLAEIQAKLDDELNEVNVLRIKAERAEQVARAEFVKSEAAARAEAVRETAIHAESLAEAQKLHIIAEAEAEAAKLRQRILEEIAAKKAAKKVHIKDNTTVVSQQSEELHQVPEVPQVTAVVPKIEPEHIADFRKSFAKVMRIRAQANAREMVSNATFAEAKTNLMSIKKQQDAITVEQLAIADSLEAQSRTRFNEIEIKTAKEMDVVESKYRQHVVEAESFRKETEAQVIDLKAQADALEQVATARAVQLLAERQAVVICGQNDIEELKITLWAVQERGDAEYSKLMTEAKSITDSQEALALQIDSQVDSAKRYLDAELAKIEKSIQSSERIAQADYQQTVTSATVLRQKTDAEINRTTAQFTMEHSILKAQIIRDRELALSQNLRGEAACDRMVAEANTTKIRENANFDASHTTAQADVNIILADNSAKRKSAQAYLDAVKARFGARVEQVRAERVIDMAEEYNETVTKRTDLSNALSKAIAAREDSSRKLAILQKRQAELQTASLVNWSDKLAMLKKD